MEGNGQQPIAELLQKLLDAVNGVKAEQAVTNAKLDQTNARLDQTNARLDQANAKLDQTREELVATREDLGTLIDGVREDLGTRIDGVRLELVAVRAMARADEREDQELRGRVERIELHLGLQSAP